MKGARERVGGHKHDLGKGGELCLVSIAGADAGEWSCWRKPPAASAAVTAVATAVASAAVAVAVVTASTSHN